MASLIHNEGVLRELARLKKEDTSLPAWHDGMSKLLASGVLDVLRELGRVNMLAFDTENYVTAQAAEASRAFGVNQALDLLLHFRELLLEIPGATTIPADFSGVEAALKNQDLTEEEANAIRNDQPIPRLQRTPIPNATRGERKDYST